MHLLPSRSVTFNTHLITKLLTKKETGPMRDPLIIYCHIPFMVAWALWLLMRIMLGAHLTTGQLIYSVAFMLLYGSSTYYHYHTPSVWSRIIDQTAIGWFILAVPLAVISNSHIWLINMILALVTAVVKWQESARVTYDTGQSWSTWDTVGSCFHLSLGVWSSLIMIILGIPELGVSWDSQTAWVIYSVIGLFLLEWIIYHFDVSPKRLASLLGYRQHQTEIAQITKCVGRSEIKHMDGALAKTIFNLYIFAPLI